jgi:uncharacterized protein
VNESSQSKIRIVLGLVFALGFSTLMIRQSEHELVNSSNLLKYEIVWWAAVAAVLLYVLFVERRPLSSVGYRRIGLSGVGIAVAAAVLLMAGLALIVYVIVPALHLSMPQQVNKLLALPLWCRLILVIRGVVAGELFYRGYGIERLQELTRSRAVAGITSCVLFALANVPSWSWAPLIFVGFAGIILTVLYLWRRNLWINMITHLVVDGVGVLAA